MSTYSPLCRYYGICIHCVSISRDFSPELFQSPSCFPDFMLKRAVLSADSCIFAEIFGLFGYFAWQCVSFRTVPGIYLNHWNSEKNLFVTDSLSAFSGFVCM